MSQVSTPHHVLLSQSYRFGPAIATAATAILRSLGAKHPVRGLEAIQSHLALVHPQVILSRTNAGVIGNVLKCLYCRMPCHVLGGTSGLEILLTDVRRVKQGQSPELFEIHDHRWCPAILRNLFTDALQAIWMMFDSYRPIVPLLRQALEESGTNHVIDLCSGAGGPWLQLARNFEEEQAYKITVLLTDLHPQYRSV